MMNGDYVAIHNGIMYRFPTEQERYEFEKENKDEMDELRTSEANGGSVQGIPA